MSDENPRQIAGPGLKPLNINSNNMPLEWKNWLTQLKIYLRANMLEDAKDSRKVAILLHNVGRDALTIFYSFSLDIDTVKFQELIDKFEKHFLPQINITIERHKLFNRRQGEDESIEQYITDLKNIANQCDFGELQDNLLRDIFSWNLNSKNQFIKEKIIQEKPSTLENAIELAKHQEMSRQQAKMLENSSSCVIGEVNRRQSTHTRHPSRSRQSSQPRYNYSQGRHISVNRQPLQNRQTNKETCTRCGQVHRFKCPAAGIKCKICNKFNHFAVMCRFNKSVKTVTQEALQSNESSSTLDGNFLFIGTVNTNNLDDDSKWMVDFIINNKNVEFLMDSGADANILSYNTFTHLNLDINNIQPSLYKLSTFSGELLPTVGQCNINVMYKNTNYLINFYILDINCQNTLGRKTCKILNLLKKVNTVTFSDQTGGPEFIINSNSDLFQGLGCIRDFEVNLTLKPDAKPSIDACRRIPLQLQKPLKEELVSLEKNGVIQRVEEPTDWVSSIVLTTKKDKRLRLCIDPRKLNQAIMRPHYQFPTLYEIKSDLSNAKYFSTLDANKGFWMLKLNEQSSKLCTFITPYGRYRFTRLPFGINAAPEIFHSEMVKRFGDLPGVKIMMDDFLVYGKNIKEHNENLQKVLQRAREINLKFNREKSVICQTKVKYLGHIFSNKGVSVDDSKVEAICKMQSPTSVTELQRFLGMVNYLGSFIKNLTKETTHLRKLLQKDTVWIWTNDHEKEFHNLKKLISTAPVLTYYDPNKQLLLSVDSSKDALGAVLSHSSQPIAYASATLTKSQQNYSQIEKELLAVLFGCTKFHHYTYGRQVTVETDHKPLVTLYKKALFDIPPRLQRIMLRLQPYELQLVYKPGKYLFVADTLSRAALPDNALTCLEKDIDLHINLVMSTLSVSPDMLKELENATLKDQTLSQVTHYYHNGWPEHKKSLSQPVRVFFSFKDQIHVIDNIVFKSNCIIIPESMRENILKIIHQGHQGITSCIKLAKNIVYWPNITSDIEKYVNQCNICLTFRRSNSKEPMIHHDFKLLPWNKVGTDLFELDGTKYLIVVDYFSKYIEIALLHSGTSAKHIITHLKSIFARHGIPSILVSDNGPPFNSQEFKDFTTLWHIQHITSSPYLSRSNGMAERSVAIIKNMLIKCKADKSDPYLALLTYRNTPKDVGYSPSQLLMNRKLRTQLPSTDSQLQSETVDTTLLKEKITRQKVKNNIYYNQHTKQLKPLNIGDKIYYKKHPNSTWTPGIITQSGPQPRSYTIQSSEGTFRRNRHHILKPKYLSQSPSRQHDTPTYSPSQVQSSSQSDCIQPETNTNNTNYQNTNTQTDNNTNIKYSSFGRPIIRPRHLYE